MKHYDSIYFKPEVRDFLRRLHFSHRTDPKPRPEGYRNFSEEGTIGQETCDMVERGMFMPEDDVLRFDAETYWQYGAVPEPVEALEGSQTGEVPPEPSKGQGYPPTGVETASCEKPLNHFVAVNGFFHVIT